MRTVLAAGALAVVAGSARAQIADPGLLQPASGNIYDRGRNISVLQRPRPEYQALGISEGGFTLFPRLETGVGYLDNVYATKTATEGGAYVALDPSLQARSNWSRDELTVEAGAHLREFFDQSAEDENGWFVDAAGRLDLGLDTALSATVFARHIYEDRTSGAFPGGAIAPVPLTQTGVTTKAVVERSRVRLTGALGYQSVDYDDVAAFGGGVLDQNYRDRNEFHASLRAEVARTPSTAFFGELSTDRLLYDGALPGGLANRDATETRFLAGATFDFSALIRGQAALGYVDETFDAGYAALRGVSVDSTVEYFFTPLTTFTFNLKRSIEDSGDVVSAGYFANLAEARVDHELLRNLILSAGYRFEYDTYNGPTPDVTIQQVQAGAKFLLSRDIGIAANLRYTRRDGDQAFQGSSYDATSFIVSVVFQR